MRNDLAQLPIIYYVHTPDRGSAVEVALLDLSRLAATAREHSAPDVRYYGTLLQEALGNYATHVAETFLDLPAARVSQEPVESLLAAAATDHAHQIGRGVWEAEVTGEVHAEG